MNRITNLFNTKKNGILSVFFTAGYPNLDDTKKILKELENKGIDMVEIGIPFSDPMADGLTGTETVLDLYCGTGTITLCLARQAKRAIGVELVEAAIRDAQENARRNGIGNAEFFCADAGQAAQRLCAAGETPDVIVVDPPRKGLSADVIEAMVRMAPQRIVYVSCDPATLARDVRSLTQQGYALTHAEAVDLVPRCAHVETVCRLERVK